MSMRLIPKAEFDAILVRDYGCRKIQDLKNSELWENHSGKGFSVPLPEEDASSYPDFILDGVIKRGNLEFGAQRQKPKEVGNL